MKLLFPLLVLASCSSETPPPAKTPSTSSASAPSALDPLAGPAADLGKEAMASQDAVAFVRDLAKDVGARPAGSAAYAKAVDWAEKRLTAEGFANVHREPAVVTHWERGPAVGAIVSKGKRTPLDLLALGRSGSTPPQGIDASVVRVATEDEAKALTRKDLEGKILFIDMPMSRERDGSGYMRTVPARFLGPAIAAKNGAVGAIVRSISPDPALPHTGTTAVVSIPAVAIAGANADALRDALAADPGTKVHLEVTTRTLPDAPSFNVVGEIPGKERPDEIVLLGGHLDSWDVGEGAADDGAGCAIVAEAARMVGKHAPKRTLRVVFFAAEEIGIGGASAYAKAHEAELGKIVVATEADAGEGRAFGFRANAAPDAASTVVRIGQLLAPLGVETHAKPGHAGTDVEPLLERGVPVFQIEQDMNAYFDIHHTRGDVFAHIDQQALTQATAAYAVMTYAIANIDETLGRAPAQPHQ